MHVIICIRACEFWDEILLRGEEYKTWVNLNFSKKKKKGKHGELATTIDVENLEFF